MWVHSDHLGSATVLADKSGTAIRRLAYKAFGEEIVNTGAGDAPPYTYTGKELDSSGLMYYGARHYDPALARFITPDTVEDRGTQGLNRYAYALNNPIRYTDPTGHWADEWKHWEQELSGNIATHLARFPVDDLDEATRTRLTDAIILYQAQKLQHKYGALMATARLLPWRQRIYRTLLPLYTRFPANHGLSNKDLNAFLEGVTTGYTSALADVAGEAAGQMLANRLACRERRILPGTPGQVTGGSSTQLGKNMMDAMGLSRSTTWRGYQAQHIIPAEMASHPIIQKIGMNLDDASNGIFLRVPDESVSTLSRHCV